MKRLTERDFAPDNERFPQHATSNTLAAVYALLRDVAARHQPDTDDTQPDDEQPAEERAA